MPPYYFDHNATTPVRAEVLDAFTRAAAEVYGNASSIHHYGQIAKQQLEAARRRVAALFACDAREVVFTSGGTESDNLAILGAVRASERDRKHVVTTHIEHPAVLSACAQLEREGVAVTYVPVASSGLVDPDQIRRALCPDTVLVSVMHANNEIGTVQPVREIAALAHEAGALFHCDGVQAAGKLAINVRELGIDLYSISGHKLYAPKGIGALYVRDGVHLQPVLFGGRHERERRAGTENVPGAVAFGLACELAQSEMAGEALRLSALRDRLERRITAALPDAGVNGARAPRIAGTTNVYFDGIEGEAVVIALDLRGFAVSSGSACSSGAVEPSHVLLAIGAGRERAKGSVRFSLGRENTAEQIDELANAVIESVIHLRKLSPVYPVSVS